MQKRKRETSLSGMTYKTMTGCGNLYVTVNFDASGDMIEVFAKLGKSGDCLQAQTESLTRMITLAAKYGIPIDEIVEQLKGIRCEKQAFDQGMKNNSCADAIGKVIEKLVVKKVIPDD